MKLSLKKCLLMSMQWFGIALFAGLLSFFMWFGDREGTDIFVLLPCFLLIVIFLVCPAVYYFGKFLTLRKKCEEYTPVKGVVSNWETGFLRGTAAIIVKVEEEEYSTAAYYGYNEAKELVGKTIDYAIIDQRVFVYQVNE